MLDRITSLVVFGRVAALGSFAAAARALGLSQTMITKHVAALEAHLGARLFHRTTRRLSLTDAGRRYLEGAERVLAELQAADAAVSAERLEPRGHLRVNAPVVFGTHQVAPLLRDFAVRAPLVTVELGLNDRQVDLAEEGWDLAIRIGTLRDSSLVARRLARCATVVCAAPPYLAARGTPRCVGDLSSHNCLLYTLSRAGVSGRWAFGVRSEIEVRVSGMLRANNGDALRAAAIAGLGVIYEPLFIVADDLRAGTLVRIDLDHPTVEFGGVYAIRLPGPEPAPKLRAFIDFMVECFDPPPWEF